MPVGYNWTDRTNRLVIGGREGRLACLSGLVVKLTGFSGTLKLVLVGKTGQVARWDKLTGFIGTLQ